MNRKHFKCVWETEPKPSEPEITYHTKIRKELEDNFKQSQIIVDQYKKSPIKFKIDDKTPTIYVLSKNTSITAFSFEEKGPIVAKLQDPIYIFSYTQMKKKL